NRKRHRQQRRIAHTKANPRIARIRRTIQDDASRGQGLAKQQAASPIEAAERYRRKAGGSRLGMFERSEAERVCPAAPPDEVGEGKSGRAGQTGRRGTWPAA